MKVAVPLLAPILRSDVQGRLLAAILADPDLEHTVTDLAIHAGTSLTTALREIDRAEAAQVVTTRRLGNTRLVKANPANPLYQPYRDIILATYGPPAVITKEFAGIDGIEHLYLFGSWAARYYGEPGRTPNDIDVLVIGNPDRDELYDAAEQAERHLRLPVQVTIRDAEQWDDHGDSFITEVRSRPLVSLRNNVL
jgi:predicted nucleotidyltransferase